ncbi:MAG: GNAT family N-acetyltransferase [Rhodocyclaceae bacterium]|nr:GNAT family N-acetyltransferase [Rhodocyclaceae bacterium]
MIPHSMAQPGLSRQIAELLSAGASALMPVAARLAPGAVLRWALDRMLARAPRALTASERELFGAARASSLRVGNLRVPVWEWGEAGAPRLVFMHGWGGRAADFAHLIRFFAASGYRVSAFDAPGHGAAPGEPCFAGMLEASNVVLRSLGRIQAVVAYDFGAWAYARTAAAGQAQQAVLVAPPADLEPATRAFARRHKLPETLQRRLRQKLAALCGMHDLAEHYAGRRAGLPDATLVVHDLGEPGLPPAHAARIARAWPGGRLFSTAGLSAGALLADRGVAEAIRDFLRGGFEVPQAYPQELESTWSAPDGTRLSVRPMRPGDVDLETRFVRELSPRTRYQRLLGLRKLSAGMIARLCHVDYRRELALVALTETAAGPRLVGVARYVATAGMDATEIALTIADDWQGRGLGSALLGRLVTAARARGVGRLDGITLADNAGMLGLAAKLGFDAAHDAEDSSVLRLSLAL